MVFALAGNQNSGKTTLFNQLTGSNQHVGNFPGVTVDKKEGFIRNHHIGENHEAIRSMGQKHVDAVPHPSAKEGIHPMVVDLPGIYSIYPYSAEEIVTCDFLLTTKPDGIINIVDATNIERNLYLSTQLMELNIPMVIALNMMDEMRSNGNTVDVKKLEAELGVPVVPISAVRAEGIDELVERAMLVAETHTLPKRVDFCSGSIHRCIHAIAHIVEDHAEKAGVPMRFAATRLVEGDKDLEKKLGLVDNEIEGIEHFVKEMERELGTDREAALADMRYSFIENACEKTVKKVKESKEYLRSIAIDKILTNKYLGIPMFFAIMFAIFYLTFNVIGSTLADLLGLGIDALTAGVDMLLTTVGVNDILHALVIDGIFAGVGAVLGFLPLIVVLFFFLSILEDTGYMARVAFIMDKLLRKIGLSGRSFVPLLIGFGCSVPAIMATRTLPSERDRRMTIFLTPYMSCTAKLPIYAVFSAAFFPDHAAYVMIGIYFFAILSGIAVALVMKKTIYKGEPIPFVMELPNYRMPSFKTVMLLMWQKAKEFLERAFTVIFTATIIIWLLQTLDGNWHIVNDASQSMLAAVGKFISPIFAPLGFTDWRATTALLTGFSAKEAVISTLAVLTGASEEALGASLTTMFPPLVALSYLCFSSLYTSCLAAIAAVKKEYNSLTAALGIALAQSGIAWVITFVVYNTLRLFVH